MGQVEPEKLTVRILTEIRDAVRETNSRLDQTNERLDRTNERLDCLEQRQVETETRLATVLNTTSAKVNSLHNQAIDELGQGVRIAATENHNKIVQAIEVVDQPFCIGVQWHPEYLPQVHRQQKLFRTLVKQAVKSKSIHPVTAD